MKTFLLFLVLTLSLDASAARRQLSDDFECPANGKVKVAFFDADSTLRVTLSGEVSANDATDVLLLPGVGKKLGQVAKRGYLVAIVSNQGGIPQHVSFEEADAALAYTAELAEKAGGEVHYYDFAENDDENRKPGVGMALRLEKKIKEKCGNDATLVKSLSFMVGDSAYRKAGKKPGDVRPDGKPGTHFSNSDRLFAEAYRIKFAEAAVFFGWRKHGIDVFTHRKQVEDYLKKHR